jgi:hypothetical protein
MFPLTINAPGLKYNYICIQFYIRLRSREGTPGTTSSKQKNNETEASNAKAMNWQTVWYLPNISRCGSKELIKTWCQHYFMKARR